jgi:predicted enzyme related to lactoylglutathione lyase
MINAVEIAFTVVPVSSLAKGRAFYEGVLGLTPTSVFDKGDMGFIEYDIGAGTLAIGCGAPLFKPAKDGGAVALEVADFDRAISNLKQKDCVFAMDAQETPVCRMAVVKDPDGNFLMIHKKKSSGSDHTEARSTANG